MNPCKQPTGYRWRSSTSFVLSCIAIALFAESFLYGFVVPILPDMLQYRNHVDPKDIQRLTYQILTLYGAVSVASALFIGQLADLASSRRMPLVISLAVALVGTLVLAASTNLWGVFLGRTLQGIGGTAAWIVGIATLRDSIDGKNMGKAFGLVHSFVSVGALSGPAVAGLLLELTGYWITWASALLVLAVDIAMRLLMLEQQRPEAEGSLVDSNPPESAVTPLNETTEDSGLTTNTIPRSYNSLKNDPDPNKVGISTLSFYKVMFGQSRVRVALLCSVVYSAMLASYNTTIPTHVKFAFGWGSLSTGLLFVGLQGPTIVMAPLCGWVRDKVGTRLPATIGFISLAPLLFLLGAADQKQFPWAKDEDSAKAAYITAIIGIGCVTNLMSSVGTIEITGTVDDLEFKNPGLFGPNGGYSRSYSLSNLSFSIGLLLGPLLSGALSDSVGYYHMNIVLACICVSMSIMAFSFLSGRSSLRQERYESNREQ